ncbi:MAG: recombinase family protein [Acidobacteriia bacterium]|nr:recombinase family protein [Terriglobia bacterium]
MNGVIYCRVSSKEQIEGTSLESQEAACREYAHAKGIHVLKVFVEQGESAKFADRTQLLDLVDFCRRQKGVVNVLIVWKIDRFARNVADHFSVKATLAKYGVRIASVTEPIDTNPEGKLMETILAGFAQFDNDIRAMRTVQGMRRKIQEGIFPWGPPLGYKSSVSNSEKKTSPDLPDETTFPLIQKAFRTFATGGYTQTEMGHLMQSWGLSPSRGERFSPQSLHQLFTNPYYAAILVDPWTGDEHDGKHAAAVTQEDFARVQEVISARNRSTPHQKEREEFPLRGLVRCNACSCALTAGFSRGRTKRYAYYLCQRPECTKRGKSYPATEIHDEFTAFLDEIAPRPGLLEELGERVIREAAKDTEAHAGRRQRRRKRVAELTASTQELIKMRAKGLITDEEFLAQKRSLAAQRLAVEHREKSTMTVDQVCADLHQIKGPLTALRETWRSLKSPFRGRFERLILPGGFVNGTIGTADLGLLFSFFRASAGGVSYGVPLRCVRSNPLLSEIRAFVDVLNGVEEEKSPPKRRFENSHRSRLRMRNSNHGA